MATSSGARYCRARSRVLFSGTSKTRPVISIWTSRSKGRYRGPGELMGSGYQLELGCWSLFAVLLLAVFRFLLEFALESVAAITVGRGGALALHFSMNGLHASLGIQRSINGAGGQERDFRC